MRAGRNRPRPHLVDSRRANGAGPARCADRLWRGPRTLKSSCRQGSNTQRIRHQTLVHCGFLYSGCSAPAGADRLLRDSTAHDHRRELLRVRRHQQRAGISVRQLRRVVLVADHPDAVPEDHRVRAHRVGHHAGGRFHGFLLSRLPCPQHPVADGAFSTVHGAVLDLEHHPHDLLDSVPRPQRDFQPGAHGTRSDQRAARVPAVL